MGFVMYGAVIIMNLLVALMTNVLDNEKAQVMIIALRVKELSNALQLPLLGLFNSCKVGITSFISSTKTTKDPELISKEDGINLEDFHKQPVENHPSQAVSVRNVPLICSVFFNFFFFLDEI